MEVETIKTANYGYMWLYGPDQSPWLQL